MVGRCRLGKPPRIYLGDHVISGLLKGFSLTKVWDIFGVYQFEHISASEVEETAGVEPHLVS